jgi:type II secretory ATPase GspE/PulE/Tfp pilus assembly ATPase PilB-like protein
VAWCLALVALLICADGLMAQGDWPRIELNQVGRPHDIDRGPGGYFSLIKVGLLLAIYWLWVTTSDWVNRDCQTLRLSYGVWNSAIYYPFIPAMVLAVTIPLFAAGYALVLLAYLLPLGIYIFKRNGVVDPHQRVLTPAHIRYLFAQGFKQVGVKLKEEKQAAHEKGAPVVFVATEGSTHKQQTNEIAARQSEGFFDAKSFVAEIIDQRAEKAMLDYGQDGVSVRFQIDGVWHDSEPQARETGDAILTVLKTVANLPVQERRQRQTGRFVSEYKGTKYKSLLISQGTQNGERVILQFDGPTASYKSVTDLGMREKMAEELAKLMGQESGFVLFSAIPANGLSTTVSVALKLTDRYMRDFAALQDIKNPEPLADNIEATTWDTSKGEVPEKVLLSLIRKDPNGIVCNQLPNAEVVKMLCQQAVGDKLIIATIQAKEAVEALLRILLMKVPAELFGAAVTGVVNQRMIRKLCVHCKEAYEPAPALLQKLGIPAGRIDALYRPPELGEKDKVCPECNGVGYYGRTAIFELLLMNDEIRDALVRQPKLEVLRSIARKTGNRNLQQEGVLLVAQGITSLAELSRVMKQ